MEVANDVQKGGHYIIADTDVDIFTPEDFTEEQQMIMDTVSDFRKTEYEKVADLMEHGEFHHNRDLLKKLGDLGFLGTHMPEAYGGLQMEATTNAIVKEAIGGSGAFSTTFGAHTGIGMLPILYYGTEEQKQKYLPGLIAGDLIASYCLTEPGSGSDALAAKTRADLSEDGKHYIINGQKMWITNAGFADVFIVFAKINGEDFTGFILEKGMEGLSLAAEEKKLGIKGSSTRQVFFENVKVPVENLLGEQGKGHLIAFNVLNAGRYKIGPFALGGAKGITEMSIKYANERIQFGQPIASFGAVKAMIADEAVQVYVGESAVYRTAGLLHEYAEMLMADGKSYADAELIAAEEYALESSILKIYMSEVVNDLANTNVQLHGGMGYSEETRASRSYRDARISMIYEGTNEINRMLMLNLIFKKAMKGKFDFATPAMAVQQELLTGSTADYSGLSDEAIAVKNYRKLALALVGTAGQLAMSGKLNLKHEQQILMGLADILTGLYISESTLLRHEKANSTGKGAPKEIREALLQLAFRNIDSQIRNSATEVIGSMIKEGKQEGFVQAMNKFCSYPLRNTKELKKVIADYLIEANEYNL